MAVKKIFLHENLHFWAIGRSAVYDFRNKKKQGASETQTTCVENTTPHAIYTHIHTHNATKSSGERAREREKNFSSCEKAILINLNCEYFTL